MKIVRKVKAQNQHIIMTLSIHENRKASSRSTLRSFKFFRAVFLGGMVLFTLFLGVTVVFSTELGKVLLRALAEKVDDFQRRNRAIDGRIEKLKQRIEARTIMIAALQEETQLYALFSDSLGRLPLPRQLANGFDERFSQGKRFTQRFTVMANKPSEISSYGLKTSTRGMHQNYQAGLDESPFLSMKERPASAINAVFDKHRPVLQDLYRRIRRHDPSVKGSLTICFKLTKEGRIKDLKILKSTLDSSELKQEILEKIRKWNDFGEGPESDEDDLFKITLLFGD
ncbi:MAG: AgmX/PglI C-terminal domain-containing protein [bacterium]